LCGGQRVERLLLPEEPERAKSEEGENKRRHGKNTAKNMDTPIEPEPVRRRRQPQRAG
jgi:hypothetical protein